MLVRLSIPIVLMLLLGSCSTGGSVIEQLDSSETGAVDATPTGAIVQVAEGRYIVGLAETGDKGTSAVNRMTAQLRTPPDQLYDAAFSGFAGQLTADEVAQLQADPAVAFIEPDLVLRTQAQTLGWGVNRVDAELNSRWVAGTGGSGVGVAVFDTGIDTAHPDLAGAVVASYDATGSGSALDGNGHGTHVAGIIGARKNSIGYAGVAPSCKLINVKVLGDSGEGQLSWTIAGINWAISKRATHNIKVGNMSLGATGTSTALATAVSSATSSGIILAVAAGNDAVNTSSYIPARYPNVICVSALTSSNRFAGYSNYGSAVDLIAPGSSIPSLWKNGGYASASGTSMAAPHVAGALALWFDNHSGGFSQALAALQGAAEPGTWTGDPDGTYEKLLDAQSL